jgi:(1->4)-alpha-D-glucan 1-alpha-D-glucosylmutase
MTTKLSKNAAAARAQERGPRIPRATYRLQMGEHFTLRDATEVVPYLAALGISDCYLSPLLAARRSSTHGYDVVDYGKIDPRIGTEEDLEVFHRQLRSHGMGLLLDVVPNHMGVGEGTNPWWMDVLEFGESSPYADYFDIDWETDVSGLEHRVLLPVLEDQYGAVLESGRFRLECRDGTFALRYHDRRFPIAPLSYPMVLQIALRDLRECSDAGDDCDALQTIIAALDALPGRDEADPQRRRAGREWARDLKQRLAVLSDESTAVKRSLVAATEAMHGRAGDPASFDRMDELLEIQPYRLASWRVAADEVNYRRFFDVSELAAIRPELQEVFAHTHQLVFDLVRRGIVTGLRIDHPDGLRQPAEYFRRVQEAAASAPAGGASNALYVVVEKILSEGESLAQSWPVSGTTGYDFLADVNGVLVDRRTRGAFDRLYRAFTGSTVPFREVAVAMKKLIMLVAFAGEVQSLGRRLHQIASRHRHYRDFTRNSLVFALREVIAALPVYRTYISAEEAASPHDLGVVAEAVHEAKRRNPRTATSVFDFVGATMTLQNLGEFPGVQRPNVQDFAQRVQQVTGPVMAKGVEDTAFYVYNRLISLNEVGASPERFGISTAAFHRRNAQRAASWLHTLLATSTHDTKRSEDVRARIDALTEFPSEWRASVYRWASLNAGARTDLKGIAAPDRNDEYMLYQTLAGVWPADLSELSSVAGRVAAFMQKAIREAKVHTSWIEPNAAYERAAERFVSEILRPEHPFVRDMDGFVQMVSPGGYLNALSQTLMKLTAPGVPDMYQGTELWDFSLVDPDNRRPIDLHARANLLDEADSWSLAELWAARSDGRVKFHVVRHALRLRDEHPLLFASGDYAGLRVAGPMANHIIGFQRHHAEAWVVTLAPRLLGQRTRQGSLPPKTSWRDTSVALPANAPRRWVDVLCGRSVDARVLNGRLVLALDELFADLPLALLRGEV